jgi:hypothetical protein
MTYFDLYLAALYDAVTAGGKQETVEKVIAEINNPTQAGLDAYLKDPPLIACGACSIPFKLDDHKPTLQEEVLCPSCKKPTTDPT